MLLSLLWMLTIADVVLPLDLAVANLEVELFPKCGSGVASCSAGAEDDRFGDQAIECFLLCLSWRRAVRGLAEGRVGSGSGYPLANSQMFRCSFEIDLLMSNASPLQGLRCPNI